MYRLSKEERKQMLRDHFLSMDDDTHVARHYVDDHMIGFAKDAAILVEAAEQITKLHVWDASVEEAVYHLFDKQQYLLPMLDDPEEWVYIEFIKDELRSRGMGCPNQFDLRQEILIQRNR